MKSQKDCGTVAYRMHVIARDAAELTANAGGLIVDRMMSGWRVSVQLHDAGAPHEARPVQILGAELVDEEQSLGLPDEERCVLVMGADAYARAMSGTGQQIPTGCAEVLVWGESPDQNHLFGHSLSSAARAFKALAATAACISAEGVAAEEAFTSMNAKGGGVTLRA